LHIIFFILEFFLDFISEMCQLCKDARPENVDKHCRMIFMCVIPQKNQIM